MPFTLSHAAAVIPLVRGPLVPSALVAGSFAPDLPYYALLRPTSGALTHSSVVGLLVVDVPMGLALLVLFRTLLMEPLLALAPRAVQARVGHLADRRSLLPPTAGGRVEALVWVVVSVLIGAVTHVVWDSWTHADAWTVQRIPALSTVVWAEVPAFKLFQWASTVLGGVVVAGWCLHWLARAPERPVPPRFAAPARPGLVRAVLATIMVAAAAVNVMVGVDGLHATPGGVLTDTAYIQAVKVSTVRAVIGAVTAGVVTLAAYAVFRRWSRHRVDRSSEILGEARPPDVQDGRRR